MSAKDPRRSAFVALHTACAFSILGALASAPVLALEDADCLLADESLMNLMHSRGRDSVGFALAVDAELVTVRALRGSLILGERQLSLSGTDCGTRIDTVRFIVHAMRSALSLSETSPDEPSTEPAEAPPSIVHADISMAEGLSTPPTRALPGITSQAPPASHTSREPAHDVRGFVSLGADFTSARVPGVSLGPVLGLGIEGEHWSVSLALLYRRGRERIDLDQSLLVQTSEFSLRGCAVSRSASFRVGGCAVVLAGLVIGDGQGFRSTSRSVLGSIAFGGDLFLRYEVARYRISIAAGPRVMAARASFTTLAPSVSFGQPLAALSVGIFWGVHWEDEV